MKTEIRTVDAKLAATWLTQSGDNRPLRKSHVFYLSNEMKQGRWRLTHQGIAFAPDGTLMDGQHRLQAIKETSVAVPLQVSYYDAGDNINFAFPILDRGLLRSVSDITRIDNKIIQIYNILLWLGVSKRRIPPDDYLQFDTKIGHTTRIFLAACPYQRTYFTSAAVRAAGVTMLYLGKSPLDYISQLFSAWGTGNSNNTPPIVNAFMNYLPGLRAESSKGRLLNNKLFVATCYALDTNNANITRIRLSQQFQDDVIGMAKEMVDLLMQRKNIDKGDLIALKDAQIKKLHKTIADERAARIESEQTKLSMEAKD